MEAPPLAQHLAVPAVVALSAEPTAALAHSLEIEDMKLLSEQRCMSPREGIVINLFLFVSIVHEADLWTTNFW